MYTHKPFNGIGLSIEIAIYKDGVFTGMTKTVSMRQPAAELYAKQWVDDLNKGDELCT